MSRTEFVLAVAAASDNMHDGYRGSPVFSQSPRGTMACRPIWRPGRARSCWAIFVRNEDGTRSSCPSSIEADEVTVHRVSRELQVRRGTLAVGIVNGRLSRAPASSCALVRFRPGAAARGSERIRHDVCADEIRQLPERRRNSRSRAASVRGERAAARVSAAHSVQARASSVLAAGLMIGLGGGALS